MPVDTKSSKVVTSALAQPVYRLLLLGLALIALVPVGFLGFKLYQAAWDNAWREINEKHRTLAMNLAAPVGIYLRDRQALLDLLSHEMRMMLTEHIGDGSGRVLIQSAFSRMDGFRSIAFVDLNGHTRSLVHDGALVTRGSIYANEPIFNSTRRSGQQIVSAVMPSPVDGVPSILLSQPVYAAKGVLTGVLIGELRVEPIEALRRSIRFGKRGHSAIVDKTGRVVAHPNPVWMKEIRDLSGWKIVQEMMAGKTGVTEFYSAFVKEQMVAGYASVPEYGWGIMVPQPKSEIQQQVYSLLYTQLVWALLGVMLALVLAAFLVRWITRPIKQLAISADSLTRNDFVGDPPAVPDNAPHEIRQLGMALRNLVSGFQASRNHVNELNRSLQSRVEQATLQLREANARLETQLSRDYLTTLANRRCFEDTLRQTLNRRSSDAEPLCIMSIDIDNFKEINDRFGHAAGDMVLTEVAVILKNTTRPNDLIARYGGDEFVAQLRCPLAAGLERAQSIRETVECYQFLWRDTRIQVTVSIGLLEFSCNEAVDMEEILHNVDHAMYEAKRRGRNTVRAVG